MRFNPISRTTPPPSAPKPKTMYQQWADEAFTPSLPPVNPNQAGAGAIQNGRIPAGPGTTDSAPSVPSPEPADPSKKQSAVTNKAGQIKLFGYDDEPAPPTRRQQAMAMMGSGPFNDPRGF